MKKIAYIIAFVLMAWTAIGVQAEEINEITLTVSSDGPTKDDAVKNALRLAIEQAYGAFVSANTTILNDELVKDEIVTITHGAIKNFKEIAGAQLPDNRYSVTVLATVSLPNLITYAKNHGSECEFAGNTFAMQIKMFELEQKNEQSVLENLNSQLKELIHSSLNWEIEMETPKISRHCYNLKDFAKDAAQKTYIDKSGNRKVLDKDFSQNVYDRLYNFDNNDYYEVTAKIYSRLIPDVKGADNDGVRDFITSGQSEAIQKLNKPIFNLFKETINAIVVKEDEKRLYQNMGVGLFVFPQYYYEDTDDKNARCYVRSKNTPKLIENIFDTYKNEACKFVIIDNLGNVHDLHLDEIYNWEDNHNEYGGYTNSYTDTYNPNIYINHPFNSKYYYDINGISGVFTAVNGIVNINENEQSFFSMPYDINNLKLHDFTVIRGLNRANTINKNLICEVTFLIPKSEISKYSTFKIVQKNDK